MRHCHSARRHPEVATQDWGKQDKWEKTLTHHKVRRYYKNKKRLECMVHGER